MVSEAILKAFCRPYEQASVNPGLHEWTVKTALSKADSVFPNFRERIRGKVILDYGSGLGFQCVAMALAGAKRVIGLEPLDRGIHAGRKLVAEHDTGDRVTFIRSPAELAEPVDVVLSQNSFEHFPDPGHELNTMASMLVPGGSLLACFGPPWYAPRGSHMTYFCPLPWVNVLFAESTVMKVRASYRQDGAQRYVDVPGGLNMMSVAKWESLVAACGLRTEYSNYHAVKNLGFLAKIPGVRELAINDVTAILTRPASK